MNVACQKQPPFSPAESPGHPFDLSVDLFPQIVISEKEYLTLKWEVGYWRRMHKKALSKIEKLNEIIKSQKGRIRDLKNRVFGKKSEKKVPVKKKLNQKTKDQKQNANDVNNPALKDMDAPND